MPAYNKAVAANPTDTSPHLKDREALQTVADQDASSKAGKRKTKNATAKQPSGLDHADKSTPTEQMGQTPVPSSNPASILGQLPQSFPQNRKNNSSLDALNDLNSSQKVSDEHTPPVDVWARSTNYGRMQPVDQIPGLGAAGSPPFEPGFSSRGGFNTRSPPVSPPLRKARPVSYGSAMAPVPTHPRVSTSPYGYNMSAYGSPPALLPHLPQQHFYGPHDVDLGLAQPLAQTSLPQAVALKFAQIPGPVHEPREAVLLTLDGELNVLGYTGERLDHMGCLSGIEGTILDATLLSWSTGEDPFADHRPLVALTVHGTGNTETSSPTSRETTLLNGHEAFLETKVVVYSISKKCQIAELLRVPTTLRQFPGAGLVTGPAANLKVQASGNFLVVCSGDSGEVFVFSTRRSKDSVVFECLGKYWTTLQPPMQRRDSSHGPSSDADVSPADLGRGPDGGSPPILSLSGRWLAFCPASTPSHRSIGATLGDFVVHNKNSNITAGTAPSRPLPNCEVESPDVDTFFGKVAKGFAQEAVRSAKWISEKGMQTWQNYWKKDVTSPNLQPTTSSSPPVYSPHLGMAQFPPTHAVEQQGLSKDPEVVTFLDLKLLQEGQGRKAADLSLMITFHPPGGCSFLSFMPSGLGLLTANRKGDVQYVWDLMQMKHVRSSRTSHPVESVCVRQVARYERMSPSTIVDVAWDGPTGYRFALLTTNRTIHIFDLPKTAFQWPPPPARKHRPASAPVDSSQVKTEHEPAPAGGFFASAMSIAGRTQPMLATLRGRAPSVGGGITGIGASGIGLASTTGIKSSGRAVAAGLSKSLGAASETVTSIRHANQSRLYLKIPPRAGMFCWQQRDEKSVLSILDASSIKNYYVRMTKPRENRHTEPVSVFDARKAVTSKLPKVAELAGDSSSKQPAAIPQDDPTEPSSLSGFWRSRPTRDVGSRIPHPLASAEIETNAPFQPFHSDRRVTISLYPSDDSTSRSQSTSKGNQEDPLSEEKWVFGSDIRSQKQSTGPPGRQLEDEGSVIYRETKVASNIPTLTAVPSDILDDGVSHVISNTKKKKNKKNRLQAFAADDNDASSSAGDFTPHSLGPEDDLLEG